MQLELFDEKTLDQMVLEGMRNNYFKEIEYKEKYNINIINKEYWQKVETYYHNKKERELLRKKLYN